jgi:hypothetical protein
LKSCRAIFVLKATLKNMRELARAGKADIDDARQTYVFIEAMTAVLANHVLTSGRWDIDEQRDRDRRQKRLETLFAKLAAADPRTVVRRHILQLEKEAAAERA